MRGILAAAVLSAGLVSPVLAQPARDAANDVIRTIQEHMLITYVCRDVIGGAYYQAARTISESTLRSFGQSEDAALLQVERYEARIKEVIAENPKGWPFGNASASVNMSMCMEKANDTLNAARVAAAKARQIGAGQ